MLVPLVSFLVGILILGYAFIVYTNHPILNNSSLVLPLKGNKWFATGLIFISIAFILGIIGYLLGFFIEYNVVYFRYLRIAFLGIGLITIKITLAQNLKYLKKIPKFILFFIKLNADDLLKVAGIIFILLLLLKSILVVDWIGGDSWMYQLPFAARIWGLVTPPEYIFEHDYEIFYGKTTMLANFLQGFFWFIFGLENPQGANLLSFLSLVVFFLFLRSYFSIPLYLSTICILAVPLIHIAATAAYVDLPGNVCVAIAILMTYLLYIKDNFLTKKNIIIFVLAAGGAANIKYLMVPPIFIIFIFAWLRIIWLYFPQWQQETIPIKTRQISLFLSLSFVCAIIIFATEFKNLVFYGNPFYPLKVEIGGVVLNHLLVGDSNYMSDKIQAMSPLQRWIFSLLEIGAFDERRPWLWTIAMDYIPLTEDTFGMGGYFSVYVVFNIVLFFILCRRWVKETKTALILFFLMSGITVFLPFSYQLRYYMYWIMTLIALNLYLVSQEQISPKKLPFINLTTVGYFSLGILITFCVITNWVYTYPNVTTLAKLLNEGRAKPEVLAQIKDGEKVCLVGFTPLTFFYNANFHPGRNYSIKSEFAVGKELVEERCGDYRIIYHESIQY
jgi:hypothetical protein